MNLWTAIRLGAMLRPQGRLAYFHDGRSCAWGAACEAVGATFVNAAGNLCADIPATMRWEFLPHPQCPECSDGIISMFHLVAHLNDTHRWSRERIADHIEAFALTAAVAELQETA